MKNFELIKFRDNEFELDVNVSPDEDTVWLTKEQIALLFDRDRTVISRHINIIYKEGELDEKSTCAKNAQVQLEGTRKISRIVSLYNLDVVISVGYRVKSHRGILFRKWANNILKQYLLKGYVVEENRVIVSKESFYELQRDVEHIKNEIEEIKEKTFIEPVKQRLFYDGQYYDAYEFITSLIEKANKEVILIDPYFDNKSLPYLKAKKSDVTLVVCNSEKTNISEDELTLFKTQYGEINIVTKDCFHDRFIILDQKECYSLGTSLNHMGKRLFAIFKIEEHEIIKMLIDKVFNKKHL